MNVLAEEQECINEAFNYYDNKGKILNLTFLKFYF